MADIEYPIVKLDNNKFQITVDYRLYSKETIVAASYKFAHLFYIHQSIDPNSESLVQIIFESKEGNEKVSELIPKQFCNELIDQQLRYNTNKQFGKIRDMIVEEAFKPINSKC
ncbi:MAG: His-Xaa-Ser system protein HxsD [Rikenellaceae bacterium]